MLRTLDVFGSPFASARNRAKLSFRTKFRRDFVATLMTFNGFRSDPVTFEAAKLLMRLAFGYIKRIVTIIADILLTIFGWQ